MVAVVFAWLANAGLVGFVVVWMSTQIFFYLLLLLLGWRELRRQGYGDAISSPLKDMQAKFPGVWKFVLTTNVSSSIRLGAREVDVLIVGGMLDSATAGIYKVAKQFASIPARLGDPLQQAVYPDMARIWAEGRIGKFIQTIVRSGILSGLAGLSVWLGFLVFGKWIIRLTVGEEFESAYSVLLVYMLGINIFMFGIALRPAILAIGHPERILQIYFIATIIYFAVLVSLITPYGVIGAAIAQIIFHSIWFVAMFMSIWLMLRYR
jgi:O-antigen/teichoic acid export membrane protein